MNFSFRNLTFLRSSLLCIHTNPDQLLKLFLLNGWHFNRESSVAFTETDQCGWQDHLLWSSEHLTSTDWWLCSAPANISAQMKLHMYCRSNQQHLIPLTLDCVWVCVRVSVRVCSLSSLFSVFFWLFSIWPNISFPLLCFFLGQIQIQPPLPCTTYLLCLLTAAPGTALATFNIEYKSTEL